MLTYVRFGTQKVIDYTLVRRFVRCENADVHGWLCMKMLVSMGAYV